MSATQRHTATAAHGSQATYYDDSAALYADPKIRLHYPPELYERVYAFAGPAVEAALDVACGTGQCAYQLAKRYKKARHFQFHSHFGIHAMCLPELSARKPPQRLLFIASHRVPAVAATCIPGVSTWCPLPISTASW